VKTSEVMLQAADVLERHGWCKGQTFDEEGRHCILGAIGYALGMDEEQLEDQDWLEWDHKIVTEASIYMTREINLAKVAEALAPRPQGIMMYVTEPVIVTNDSIFDSPTQAIDLLRHGAKHAMEDGR
jgi:hypothetical protein